MPFEIFMPFYGDPELFKTAVLSVLKQDDPKWTLTVLDDNYPDTAPGDWLVGLNDSRITYIRNSENLLPSRNYNKALSLVNGDFFVIMGCDDVLDSKFVSTAQRVIRTSHSKTGLIQMGVRVIDQQGKLHTPFADYAKRFISPMPRTGTKYIEGEYAYKSLVRGNWTYFPSIIWKKTAMSELEFRQDLNVVQDLAMILSIVSAGFGITLNADKTFFYRRHKASFSGVTGIDGTKFSQEKKLFSEVQSFAHKANWHSVERMARYRLLSRLNALSEIPRAINTRNLSALRKLLSHALSR